MLAQPRGAPHARFNNYHGQKRQLLGNHAGRVAPSWRVPGSSSTPLNGLKGKQPAVEGSKILLSRLPNDVGETEIDVSDTVLLKPGTVERENHAWL